jgi:class 3 adenylate cyclase
MGDACTFAIADHGSMSNDETVRRGPSAAGLAVLQGPSRWGPGGVSSTEAAFSLPVGTVTFLLTDVEGSTRLWSTEDPDVMRSALVRHGEIISEAVAAHGGVRPQEQGEGDSVVAAFARRSDAFGQRSRCSWHCTPNRGRWCNRYKRGNASRGARAVDGDGRSCAAVVGDALPDGVSLIALGSAGLRVPLASRAVSRLAQSDLTDSFPSLRSVDAAPYTTCRRPCRRSSVATPSKPLS